VCGYQERRLLRAEFGPGASSIDRIIAFLFVHPHAPEELAMTRSHVVID
jgi:hypothetical protein